MWLEGGWADYLYWQKYDRKVLQRVNELIRDAQRSRFSGLGKPEPLRANLRGCWSRRVAREHRLVYRVEGETLIVMQCRFHYDDKCSSFGRPIR